MLSPDCLGVSTTSTFHIVECIEMATSRHPAKTTDR